MTDIPTFDSLAHAAATAPEGYRLYELNKAREYIKARNDFVRFVQQTIARSDLSESMKLTLIKMHPGMQIR